jgi:hypothetical protein
MVQSAFINIDLLSQEAKKELETFYEFLLFKYRKPGQEKEDPGRDKIKEFRSFADRHLIDLPADYKFNREEANAR